MAAKKKQAAKPVVETRSFQEIMEDRMPHTPTVREELADRVERNKQARAKIAAQEKQQAKRKARNARILARHNGRMTQEFYRDCAEADRAEAGR